MSELLIVLADGGIFHSIVGFLLGTWHILLVILGFGMLIFVHELGHFLAAKRVGIRVDTFSVGFGPRLFGVKHRGTEYCVRALPLGGYVKMHGQEDFAIDKSVEYVPDPDSFHAKTVGQRVRVVSAGPIANLIFAMLLFGMVYVVGRDLPAPVVGLVMAGSPAEQAGMRVGDRIREINGTQTPTFMDVQQEVALASPGEKLQITVDRPGVDHPVRLKPVLAKSNKRIGLQQIGIGLGGALRIEENLGLGDYPGGPRVERQDEVIRINGKQVTSFYDVHEALVEAQGQWCTVDVKRWPVDKDGRPKRSEKPRIVTGIKVRSIFCFQNPRVARDQLEAGKVDHVLGVVPRSRIVYVDQHDPDGPAKKAGLRAGDVIIEIDGIENPTYQKIHQAIEDHGNQPVSMTVLRDGKEKISTHLTPKQGALGGRAVVGMLYGLPEDGAVVAADVLPKSPAQEAGMVPGSRIVQLGTTPIVNWYDFIRALKRYAGQTVTIKFTKDGRVVESRFAIPAVGEAEAGEKRPWNERIRFAHVLASSPILEPKQTYNPLLAMWWGVEETWMFAIRSFKTIKSIVIDRKVSPKNISGPIGIIHHGRIVAEAGIMDLIYFLGFISVSLAAINVLPIPIMDGGLLAFLAIEKLKGSPVSIKVQIVTQLLGLFIILGLFVSVTFMDVWKIFESTGP